MQLTRLAHVPSVTGRYLRLGPAPRAAGGAVLGHADAALVPRPRHPELAADHRGPCGAHRPQPAELEEQAPGGPAVRRVPEVCAPEGPPGGQGRDAARPEIGSGSGGGGGQRVQSGQRGLIRQRVQRRWAGESTGGGGCTDVGLV